MKNSMLSIYAIIYFASRSYALVALPSTGCSSMHMMGASRSCSAMSLSQDGPAVERRRFVSGMAFAAATAAVGRATGLMETGVPPAQAASGGEGQLGDLESGPPEPMKVTQGEPLSSESARIQQKLAAQAKATGRSSSGTLSYSESMAAEGKKQAKMKAEKNDKARRRAAMCEELGRGC